MRRMVLSVGFVVAACAVYIGALYIGIGRPVEVLAQTTDTVLYEGARVIVGDGSAAIENAAVGSTVLQRARYGPRVPERRVGIQRQFDQVERRWADMGDLRCGRDHAAEMGSQTAEC